MNTKVAMTLTHLGGSLIEYHHGCEYRQDRREHARAQRPMRPTFQQEIEHAKSPMTRKPKAKLPETTRKKSELTISQLPNPLMYLLSHRREFPYQGEVGDQSLFGDAPPEPGLEALKKSWPEVWSSVREWLEFLPDTELDSELSRHVANGDDSAAYSLEDYLAHGESLHAASWASDWNAACVSQTAAQSRSLSYYML
jgi:hypothetical protein